MANRVRTVFSDHFERVSCGLVRIRNANMNDSNIVEKTAFVLAGGGSLGAVQVGMLAELIANGVQPDFIVGVSAGALNGAVLAFEPSINMVERMAVLWSKITTREVLGLSWGSLLGIFGLRNHIASHQGLNSLLQRELPYHDFCRCCGTPISGVCRIGDRQ